jgi:hypothetical protein
LIERAADYDLVCITGNLLDLCGHTQAYPLSYRKQLGAQDRGVNVLVLGQLLRAPFPNNVVLDSESGKARWQTLSQEWIAEDGLYDHLVLKIMT